MSKFCGKCGANIPQMSAFCPKCGAAVQAQQANNQVQPNMNVENVQPLSDVEQQKNKKIGIIAVASIAAVVLIVILSIVFMGSRSPEKITKMAFEAYYDDYDAKAVMNLVHEDALNSIADKKDRSVRELVNVEQEELDERKDRHENELVNYKVDWDVVEVKDVKMSELKKAQKKYHEYEYDLDITDMKTAKVEMTTEYTYEGEYEIDTNIRNVDLYKIDGEWYIDYFDFF